METQRKIETIRHSLSHLMSMAVVEKYPKAGLGVGPVIEDGFYQDYDLPEQISEKDFVWIEKRMRELIAQKIKFTRSEEGFAQALKFYKKDPYKTELIKDLKKAGEKKVCFYDSDWYHNLCKGPHVKDTPEINPDAFKLMSVAGAYWRGSEKNKMLTRIYGVAFETKEKLDEYLRLQEEAEKRDHRKLGADLDLFVFSDLVGRGLPLLTPKGAVIRKELEKFVYEEETKRGYQHVVTPDLAKVQLYETSGHYPYYKDTMYPIMKVDEDELILRPMTCPHHFMLYKSRPRSYKELPLRIAEIASQFRYEKSGELTGLMRARMFCLADAHIVVTPEQAAEEIKQVLELIDYANNIFGLKKGVDYRYRLSLGDRKEEKKYYKDDAAWDKAETVLRGVLKDMNAPYFEAEGEAAFYGPKIDVQMKKVNGHEETAFTVQYDFVMPKRFDMKYIDRDGQEKQPLVIHRSSIGCFERTMAFLIERYAGAFPVWLSPVQILFAPVSTKHQAGARALAKELLEKGIRVEVDDADETIGNKVRKAAGQKIPYIVIVGDKELSGEDWTIRVRGEKEQVKMSKEKFVEKVFGEIRERKNN
ncbi:MAG: threonine--tRNA ligase [Candidatus Magasanikbacteria bacterium]|nr:threonine--tRNA ligase [Candidatus Magasanikbacteria bacterium]